MHRNNAAIAPVNTSTDSSYLDLVPGTRVRVVVPLFKTGDTGLAAATPQAAAQGGTIVLSASNLIGYRTCLFFVEAHRREQVRLRFIGAETTRDGKTETEESEPQLPFALPSETQHLRLIYYVRASRADHNMALAGSKDMNALIAFTKRFETNPEVCGSEKGVFCAWVPAGVAVRPE